MIRDFRVTVLDAAPRSCEIERGLMATVVAIQTVPQAGFAAGVCNVSGGILMTRLTMHVADTSVLRMRSAVTSCAVRVAVSRLEAVPRNRMSRLFPSGVCLPVTGTTVLR